MTVQSAESSVRRAEVKPGELLIAGEWGPAADGATYETLEPATGRALTTVAKAGDDDADDADRAVAAARRAFDAGEWPRMTPRARGRVLLRVAQLLAAHADELAELEGAVPTVCPRRASPSPTRDGSQLEWSRPSRRSTSH
jgi:delta 1-pyrroline-5-carboxylate dehydrogenase